MVSSHRRARRLYDVLFLVCLGFIIKTKTSIRSILSGFLPEKRVYHTWYLTPHSFLVMQESLSKTTFCYLVCFGLSLLKAFIVDKVQRRTHILRSAEHEQSPDLFCGLTTQPEPRRTFCLRGEKDARWGSGRQNGDVATTITTNGCLNDLNKPISCPWLWPKLLVGLVPLYKPAAGSWRRQAASEKGGGDEEQQRWEAAVVLGTN